MGTNVAPPVSSAPVPQAKVFSCYTCGFQARTLQGIKVHLARDHPLPSDPAAWAQGTVCQACLYDHGSQARLVKHLSRNRRCRQACSAYLPHLSEQEANDNRRQVREERQANRRAGRPENYAAAPPGA